jgi:hypothetical protein
MAGKRGGALPAPVWERFWSKVDRQGPTDCWLWTGALNDSGYGAIWDGERLVYAHRLSWLFQGGKLPARFQLDHLCRTRACVNPAHLELVTHKANVYRGFAARLPGWVPPPDRPAGPTGREAQRRRRDREKAA